MYIPSALIDFKLSTYNDLLSRDWAKPKLIWGLKEISIVNEKCGDNNYPILCDNGEQFSLNGKNKNNSFKLKILYHKRCPLIDGRLVNDETFAIRLLSFVENTQVNDPCSDDEKSYLIEVAKTLLDWQVDTVRDKTEIDYLKRVGKI